MRHLFGFLAGLAAVIVAAIVTSIEATHAREFVERIIPKWLEPMIDPKFNLVVIAVGFFLMGLAWLEWRFGEQSHTKGHSGAAGVVNNTVGNPTATATGNQIVQNFNLPNYPMEDFAKVLASELKAGAAEKIDVDANDSPAYLIPGDGFVQLEDLEFIVQAVTLEVEHTINLKYMYANRGGLPVYEVQTWGLLTILDPAKNPAPQLKALMLASARDGHKRFPGAATLGVQRTGFSYAPLPEALTQTQINSLRDQSESLFFLVCGVWKDSRGQVHFWSAAQKAILQPSLSLDKMSWMNL